MRLPQWLLGKESACSAGDVGSIPRWRRSPGGGNGNPLQYSCLGNSMDRGAWRAILHRVAKELITTYGVNNNNMNVCLVRASKESILPSIPKDTALILNL